MNVPDTFPAGGIPDPRSPACRWVGHEHAMAMLLEDGQRDRLICPLGRVIQHRARLREAGLVGQDSCRPRCRPIPDERLNRCCMREARD